MTAIQMRALKTMMNGMTNCLLLSVNNSLLLGIIRKLHFEIDVLL